MNDENIKTSAILPSTSTEYGNASNETTNFTLLAPTQIVDPPAYKDVNPQYVNEVINDLERFCSSAQESSTSGCSIDQRKRYQKRQKKDDDASLFEQEIKAFRQLFSDCSSDEDVKKEFLKELSQVRLNLYKKYYLKLKFD